ncbi:hypothetical protein [Streptomyces incanus]|uniref:Uncharacterized protein n=1 Tax=Streptomyces incanus TaxID=887453 RepID=A0ABW0XSZ8_9ACTN
MGRGNFGMLKSRWDVPQPPLAALLGTSKALIGASVAREAT